jgi:chemotaxis response regulator CheB
MERICLLVTDNHPVMLTSQPDFEVVGEAVNGAEAVTLRPRLHPRVVLMIVS